VNLSDTAAGFFSAVVQCRDHPLLRPTLAVQCHNLGRGDRCHLTKETLSCAITTPRSIAMELGRECLSLNCVYLCAQFIGGLPPPQYSTVIRRFHRPYKAWTTFCEVHPPHSRPPWCSWIHGLRRRWHWWQGHRVYGGGVVLRDCLSDNFPDWRVQPRPAGWRSCALFTVYRDPIISILAPLTPAGSLPHWSVAKIVFLSAGATQPSLTDTEASSQCMSSEPVAEPSLPRVSSTYVIEPLMKGKKRDSAGC
jgi:hypothetical protein